MPEKIDTFIDTHCHLDFPQFDADRPAVIARAQAAGVAQMVVVGADLNSSRNAQELAGRYPEVLIATAGIHPHYALQAGPADIGMLETLAEAPAVRAIGEVGLDYFDHQQPDVPVAEPVRDAQRQLFRQCIAVALRCRLPLVLHCRQACADMIQIIREDIAPRVPAVLHCFSGDTDFLSQVLELGLYVSFTATVTYPRAERVRQAVAATPWERLMIETDAPYLAPQTIRGRRNEPAQVRAVAAAVADIKRVPLTQAADVTTQNARRFFSRQAAACGSGDL